MALLSSEVKKRVKLGEGKEEQGKRPRASPVGKGDDAGTAVGGGRS
jgi:hypothetical protein